MWDNLILAVIGLAGGSVVATGLFALITMLGLVNRYAQDTGTAVDIVWYEECVIWGASLGSIIYIFQVPMPVGALGLAIFGFFGGIYAGCLAVSLAEIIKAFPIMIRRFHIGKGLGMMMLGLALGKGIGSIIYFFALNYMGG